MHSTCLAVCFGRHEILKAFCRTSFPIKNQRSCSDQRWRSEYSTAVHQQFVEIVLTWASLAAFSDNLYSVGNSTNLLSFDIEFRILDELCKESKILDFVFGSNISQELSPMKIVNDWEDSVRFWTSVSDVHASYEANLIKMSSSWSNLRQLRSCLPCRKL